MYVYRGCAPSRCAFQTGRLPVHVSTDNDDAINSEDDSGTQGIPSGMTTIASKLKEADYRTYLIGKWDAGFASFEHLPINKGYDYFYGYLGKTIDYYRYYGYNDCPPNTADILDLWENDHPASDAKEAAESQTFVEFVFQQKVLDIIDIHSGLERVEEPFFILYSMHLPHSPSQGMPVLAVCVMSSGPNSAAGISDA